MQVICKRYQEKARMMLKHQKRKKERAKHSGKGKHLQGVRTELVLMRQDYAVYRPSG